jgi:CoA transferase family III
MQNVLVGSLGIPDAVLARARRVADDINRSAQALGGWVAADADEIVTGRAGLLGIAPAGRVSAGGSTRLLAARDGWCALTLSRDDDVETVPALLELSDQPADPWAVLADAAAERDAAEFVARARLLDLPAAVLGEVAAAPARFVASGQRASKALAELLVADLSSMWAGPLCGHLLAAAGATVVKVEGHNRTDGTRNGSPAFFDWMNSSKLSYAIDFRDDALRRLLEAADVVIESSRPAALARRDLGPEQLSGRPGRVWLRVTGYGTKGERANRVAFGDDAAVAGGLVETGPAFVGDAIADPLTGLEATLAVLDALSRGGGEVVEIALAEVAAGYAALPSGATADEPPRIPLPARAAAALGADNDRVLELIEKRFTAC